MEENFLKMKKDLTVQIKNTYGGPRQFNNSSHQDTFW